MEVTSENFSLELPGIIKAIRQASFLSFDCEFSGLGRGGAAISAFETPELLYQKWKANVSNFMLMQFGLCTFKYDPEKNLFEYSCYSFYVFPRLPQGLRGLRNMLSETFTTSVQADCLDFLAGQNFDFNKWICQGVGYLRPKGIIDVERLTDDIKKRHSWRAANSQASTSQAPTVPDGAKPKINQILKKVENYIGKARSNSNHSDPLKLTGLTAYERKLVYQNLEHVYGMQLFIESVSLNKSDNNDVTLLVRKCLTKEENEQFRKEKLNAELGKPLIGHNLNLDLLHTFRAFCRDLPPTWTQFKSMVREHFPVIVDTKVLAAQKPFKGVVGTNSSLRELLERVKEAPFTKVECRPSAEERGFPEGGSLDLDKLHNAGFDAYATGRLFLAMATYYGDSMFPGERKTRDVPWDLIRPFANKLLTGKVQDMQWVSLTGDEKWGERSHVFFIRCNNEEWTNREIQALFSPYGPVQVYWVYRPRNSAFVSLVKRDQAEIARKAIAQEQAKKKVKWRIESATEFLKSQERELLGEHYKKAVGNGTGPLPSAAAEASAVEGTAALELGAKRAVTQHQDSMDISDEQKSGKKVTKMDEEA